ncbi:Hypothetical protein LBF_2224 [Leptospira biflexa serovar Patoc strain 'Patoc 1 (Ames)']|uniref:Uncharacterized protein n=1 Tax=Leptospira biflexa serovar Patoc (strain Patoc 1 / ATCC 23582 / Paris) TaxID=456481 RepID=B0STE8_LEPBP|nr:hypothetical protein [Leptospira biflexa]ABZ94721.1 Hypothetical protein LBF_2224 [Leptospira biflexa serovar Patoc strain 'Patoc 1 (Ames)']ABZ98388.1 Conserved hypothetical protein; putative signal peptide [Leptospira biflexa serovar Patoc strain 'Patoc 1 (Paris)']
MKYSRFFLSFLLFFILSETLALSGVVWTFYESLQNALIQEQFISDHRARDLSLALAKSAEQRLNPEGYLELDKTFHRYVDESKKDPEEFRFLKISLYAPDATLLVSTDSIYTLEELRKRKPDEELSKSTFFRKGIRMKKWEWSEPENGENPILNSKRDPKVRQGFEWVLSYLPLAKSNTVRLTSPLYKPGTLDVSGLIVLVYERGNLGLLFENQWKLAEWMVVNYALIAFVVSLLLTGAFVAYTLFVTKDQLLQPETGESLPILQKKTLETSDKEGEPVSVLEVEMDHKETNMNVTSPDVEVLPGGPVVNQIKTDPNEQTIQDAIFLG